MLVAGLDFEALLLDGDDVLVGITEQLFKNYRATAERVWITREEISDFLTARSFDSSLDYLGIDLDGVDFWIWESLEIRPRLVVCEYNAIFGPKAPVTVPYDPHFDHKERDARGEYIYPKSYYAASLAGLERLGRRKGYDLVCVAPGSSNAYFVRTDANSAMPPKTSSDVFQPPTKGKDAIPYLRERYERIEREGVRKYFETRGGPLVKVK